MNKDIANIADDYLYHGLPAAFDKYLMEIGRRNLLHLLDDLRAFMNDLHWMYVEIGRMHRRPRLQLLHPELFDSFKQSDLFIRNAIQSKNKAVLDRIPFFENHFFSMIAANGGYAFYRLFNQQQSFMVDFICDMSPESFYPIMLHPDYPAIKHLLLYEALESRNLNLAMFILKPTHVVLDKWIVKCLPMPDELEKMVISRINKTTDARLITSSLLYYKAVSYGMYPAALILDRSRTGRLLQNPQIVCDFLASMICNNQTEYVRDLVKYNYSCEDTEYLSDSVDVNTSIEIIKLVNFSHIRNPRVQLYKNNKAPDELTDDFNLLDLPALLDPSLNCSKKFKISLIENISYPTCHPLHKRHPYAKEIKRLMETV